MALSVLGVNVQPLLAVGGVGGIVLGWSAQSIFGNALSGITLVWVNQLDCVIWTRLGSAMMFKR